MFLDEFGSRLSQNIVFFYEGLSPLRGGDAPTWVSDQVSRPLGEGEGKGVFFFLKNNLEGQEGSTRHEARGLGGLKKAELRKHALNRFPKTFIKIGGSRY